MTLFRAGAGERVLLLHGFTLSHHVWRATAADLAADHEVLAPTMPGHRGAAPLRPGRRGIRGMADGLEHLLDTLGVGDCHIVGSSLGGQVAYELERRGRARSVVSINCGVGVPRWDPSIARVGAAFLWQYRIALAARVLGPEKSWLQRPVLAKSVRHPADVDPGDATEMLRAVAGCRTYLPSIWAIAREGLATDPARARVPVSVLVSEFDLYPNHAPRVRRTLARYPDSVRVVDLPGVDHLPMLDAPELVAAAVREHLVWAAGRGA